MCMSTLRFWRSSSCLFWRSSLSFFSASSLACLQSQQRLVSLRTTAAWMLSKHFYLGDNTSDAAKHIYPNTASAMLGVAEARCQACPTGLI